MKILILPDIHGRTFWKKPCENPKEFDLIIFLGDYLDPYESIDGITKEEAYNIYQSEGYLDKLDTLKLCNLTREIPRSLRA